MGTIEDIEFDTDYSHATFRFLLLNNQHLNHIGPSPVIVLSHTSLLTFIHVFHDLILCQQHINSDNRKIITLVISDEKIVDWDNNINVTDYNIEKVYIFCEKYSNYIAMKKWDGCYKDKIQDIYLLHELEYHLLRLGVDYIYKIMPEFRQDRGLCRKLATHAQNLLTTMNKYFQDQIDSLDDPEGEENQ